MAKPSVFGPSAALVRALTRLLRPLIRLLIARGVTFPYLMNLVKRLYVTTAAESLGADATVSRLSITTGLQRKDINRIKSEPPPEVVTPQATSLGPRLIGIWLGDPAFRAKRGGAKALPRTSDDRREKSFEDLVHMVSTDVRPKVILDEWVRLGIVTVDKDDVIRLKSDAFVPEEGFDEKAYYLGRNVADHIAASVHNLLGEQDPLFERAVYYDRLTPESIAYLRKRAREYAMTALVALNKDALKRADDDAGKAGADRRMALGIYYYDGPDEGADPQKPGKA
ncbi:MAG: DUF6502 family protein [Rhodospirillaceae bacterium]